MKHNRSPDFDDRVSFCVGTGRCGTTFLAEVAGHEPDVAASHERERLGATFHMFCKWHGIDIDHEGFLRAREEEIRRDLSGKRFSFECSALLSHSLVELHSRFRSRIVLLVRSPAETVASFAVRGWFLRLPVRGDTSLPPSYYTGEEARHFLGRNIPHGPEFDRWARLTQIGKLAWFWAARNAAILEQFLSLPPMHLRIERLEDLDFARYRELAEFLGWRSQVNEETFATLAASRPNAGPNVPRRFPDWTGTEAREFEGEVALLADAFGYEYRVQALSDGASAAKERRSLIEVLRGIYS